MYVSNNEPKICPDCPRKSLLPLVRSESWSNAPTEDSTVKLCAKLRAYETTLPRCPHYPKGETMDNFMGKEKKKEARIDVLRREMHELEESLNKMTKGEFYCGFAARGLETYHPKELQQLLEKYPEIKETLRKAIIMHKEFYELLHCGQAREDESYNNILALDRSIPETFSLAAHTRNHLFLTG